MNIHRLAQTIHPHCVTPIILVTPTYPLIITQYWFIGVAHNPLCIITIERVCNRVDAYYISINYMTKEPMKQILFP